MASQFPARLASSKKWTDLPTEFTAKVQTIFTQQFKKEAQLGEFLIDGRIFPEEIVMRAGYLEKGRLKQINFEASMDLPQSIPDDGAKALRHLDPEAAAEGDDASSSTRLSKTEDSAEDQTMQRLYVCIDALGSLLEEYFQLGTEDELDVPVQWRAYDFEGETVYLQHSTVNTRLEEEADRLLGLTGSSLVQEQDTAEDALANAEIDSELAFEVQKAIRAGTFPRPVDSDPSDTH